MLKLKVALSHRPVRILSYVLLFTLLCGCVFAFASDDRGDPVPVPTEADIRST